MNNIEIIRVTKFDQKLLESIKQLLPQLTKQKIEFSKKELQEMVESPNTYLYAAREPDNPHKIIGSLTLTVFRIPTGKAAHIDDVVVDNKFLIRI